MAYRLLTVIQFKLGFDPMSNKKKVKMWEKMCVCMGFLQK